MKRWSLPLVGMIIALFGWFVWPTEWEYFLAPRTSFKYANRGDMRRNRLTNQWQEKMGPEWVDTGSPYPVSVK